MRDVGGAFIGIELQLGFEVDLPAETLRRAQLVVCSQVPRKDVALVLAHLGLLRRIPEEDT